MASRVYVLYTHGQPVDLEITMSFETRTNVIFLAVAICSFVGLLALKIMCMSVSDAGCYHGIAQGAYDECRADPDCVKPEGFNAEPAYCRQ